jgi:hypothetical protein
MPTNEGTTITTNDGEIELSWKAGSNRPVRLDLNAQSVDAWDADAAIPPGAFTRPSLASESADGRDHSTGFIYKNGNVAGQTGALEPAWGNINNGSTPDGSLMWTAIVPPATGQDTIQSAVWAQSAPPDGALTITGQQRDALTATAFIGGGTQGNVYVILVTVTMSSGASYVIKIELTIE